MIEVLAGTMMTVGALLALIAGIGLQRFPDVFARMHAATKPALLMPDSGAVAKLLLVVVLQFVTAPVGSHLVGRAAYRSGTELSDQTTVDELAGVDLES